MKLGVGQRYLSDFYRRPGRGNDSGEMPAKPQVVGPSGGLGHGLANSVGFNSSAELFSRVFKLLPVCAGLQLLLELATKPVHPLDLLWPVGIEELPGGFAMPAVHKVEHGSPSCGGISASGHAPRKSFEAPFIDSTLAASSFESIPGVCISPGATRYPSFW